MSSEAELPTWFYVKLLESTSEDSTVRRVKALFRSREPLERQQVES